MTTITNWGSEFYETYFNYIGDTEAPTIYHRWCAISIVAALLGRNTYLPFGHGNIYPNMYIMLVGNPGTRKGAALDPATALLKALGYDKIAPERLSPERFIVEMQQMNRTLQIEDIEFDTLAMDTPSEIYVAADEFGDFIRGNVDFVRLLTTLWNNRDVYKHPKLHGNNRNVIIHKPTVSIIGCTTQQDIALTLPLEVIGQGFLSRFILVNGDATGIKITIPKTNGKIATNKMVNNLQQIRETCTGEISFSESTMGILDRIYKTAVELDDYRFKYYNTRRFTHLLKVAMVLAAMDGMCTMEPIHAINANTLLVATERGMPKALGEFGKSKHSDVTNNIMGIIKGAMRPVSAKALWKAVIQDLQRMEELILILRNLEAAEKIQKVTTTLGSGYVPKATHQNEWAEDLINRQFLTTMEMG